MLDTEKIRQLLVALNDELAAMEATGDVVLVGGAVMCLVFNARVATKDVDAIFEPTAAIRKAADKVAADFDVPADWLNDAAKGFLYSDPPRQTVLDLPNLRVCAPTAEYMLAMKCVSARFDSLDRDDVAFLIRHLNLQTPEQVFEIIGEYYPQRAVPPKSRFLVEEILGG